MTGVALRVAVVALCVAGYGLLCGAIQSHSIPTVVAAPVAVVAFAVGFVHLWREVLR